MHYKSKSSSRIACAAGDCNIPNVPERETGRIGAIELYGPIQIIPDVHFLFLKKNIAAIPPTPPLGAKISIQGYLQSEDAV